MKKKVLIVGAGLYGSTLAYLLSKNYDITVIDKDNKLGGSCATENVDGIHVHLYGPHIFHTSNLAVWDFIRQFDLFEPFYNEPLANYNGQIYNLPFNMNTFAKMFGCSLPYQAEAHIEADRTKIDDPKTVEEYALSVVGKTIYEKLIKSYTEKQWGKSCKELPASILKRLPLRFTYNNHYFDDVFQAVPVNGYSTVISNMLKDANAIVYLNVPFDKKMEKDFDLVIYSGSIDEYYDYRFGLLQYRSLRFEHQKLDYENYQGVAVMNFTDERPYTRIIEHKHFLNEESSSTIITKEFPITWLDEKSPRYYPLQDERNKELYKAYASIPNNKVFFGGRLGSYQYLNMDKVIELAMNDAKVIIKSYE